MTPDLASWLLAQIAEDRRVAEEAQAGESGRWRVSVEETGDGENAFYAVTDEARSAQAYGFFADFQDRPSDCHRARHIATWDPARVLAECEARERIVARHKPYESSRHDGTTIVSCGFFCGRCIEGDGYGRPEPWPCIDLRLLALPYADRDGFREEWKV